MKYKNKLKGFKSRFCYHTCDNDCEVLHIQNPFILSQAIGYARYKAGQDSKKVVFRGQRSLHKSLIPSLYRDAKSERQKKTRDSRLNSYIERVFKKIRDKKVSIEVVEPMLQHYGIKTRWIDLVDNLWIALWFASYKSYTGDRVKNEHQQYLKWVPREEESYYAANDEPNEEKKKACSDIILEDTIVKNDNYAYILLLESGMEPYENKAGFWFDKRTDSLLVDLKTTVPSLFLRPHNQHALSLRKIETTSDTLNDYDYFGKFVIGIIRIAIHDAHAWLGDGLLTKPEFLFPSPFSDFMYRFLILCEEEDTKCKPSPVIGKIIRYWQ